MPRASPRSAASCSTATRARCIAPAIAGGSRPTRARSMRPRRWSRSGHGRRMCWSRSASSCRWRSSAAITGISAAQGNAALSRPVVDAEYGYLITPMEQGIRLTTGAEFAARDAAPTPVQFDRLMPARARAVSARRAADDKTWLGARPCFPDSRPVIGRAPGPGGPVARDRPRPLGADARPGHRALIGEMMAGETPFCDPAPYRARSGSCSRR